MIKKFLSDAMLSLVMDKSAKDTYRTLREHKKAAAEAGTSTDSTSAPPSVKSEPTPERAELIRSALNVHREKSHILDDLSVHDRQKLYTLAEKTLLRGKRG